MTRLFENDDVILEKDENNEYHLSFFKDGHSKSEEHYPFYGLTLYRKNGARLCQRTPESIC